MHTNFGQLLSPPSLFIVNRMPRPAPPSLAVPCLAMPGREKQQIRHHSMSARNSLKLILA